MSEQEFGRWCRLHPSGMPWKSRSLFARSRRRLKFRVGRINFYQRPRARQCFNVMGRRIWDFLPLFRQDPRRLRAMRNFARGLERAELESWISENGLPF